MVETLTVVYNVQGKTTDAPYQWFIDSDWLTSRVFAIGLVQSGPYRELQSRCGEKPVKFKVGCCSGDRLLKFQVFSPVLWMEQQSNSKQFAPKTGLQCS